MDRSNYRLNVAIERFIDAYWGTAIGQEVQNMYENGTGYMPLLCGAWMAKKNPQPPF